METIHCVRFRDDLMHHTVSREYVVTCPECGEQDAARAPAPRPGPWVPLGLSLIAAAGSVWSALEPDFDSVLVVLVLGGLGGGLGVIALARAWVARPRNVLDVDAVATALAMPFTGGWTLLLAWVVVVHPSRSQF